VPITNDRTVESDEEFVVRLSTRRLRPSGYKASTPTPYATRTAAGHPAEHGGRNLPAARLPRHLPVTDDFDGDDTTDCGRYTPALGVREISLSSGPLRTETLGGGGAVPVVGDFDGGDGMSDISSPFPQDPAWPGPPLTAKARGESSADGTVSPWRSWGRQRDPGRRPALTCRNTDGTAERRALRDTTGGQRA
jgi:hypothetical protein